MEGAWPPRAAAVFVLLTVLINWKVDLPSVRLAYTLLALAGTVLARYWKRIYIIITMLPRDVMMLYRFYKISKFFEKANREKLTVLKALGENVLRHPEKTCYFFEGKRITFRNADEYSNRVARALQRAGFRRGDTLALMMQNSPEYPLIWLGAAKLGAATALINYNLRDASLAHTVNVTQPKAVLFDSACAEAVAAARDRFATTRTLYQFDGDLREGATDFQELLGQETDEDLVASEQAGYSDPLLYVFTSGTTGLPKAAIITNARFLLGPGAFRECFSLSAEKDVVYSPLPLYHGAAGVFAVGLALAFAVPFVFVRKFSASQFWSDCIQHNATCAQYIGEVCRFVLATPASPVDKQHKVRKLFGNGLQPGLWGPIRQRFNVTDIFEFYGSTEGNIVTLNLDSTPGAIGCLPRILPASALPLAIIRVDPLTGEPIRDPNTDRCVRCRENETGMIIGQIDSSVPLRRFSGYLDKESTMKKIIKDVFTKSDRYFSSGDLVSMDEYGYIYFKDRIGDTFRWKGENVSTTEVEVTMSKALGDVVKDVAVYGVQVPGNEGKAGMAVLVDPSKELDLDLLAQHLISLLPSYARPHFVRISKEISLTGTYKVTKAKLQKEGFDVSRLEDPVYFLDSARRRFVPLTEELLHGISDGRIRV